MSSETGTRICTLASYVWNFYITILWQLFLFVYKRIDKEWLPLRRPTQCGEPNIIDVYFEGLTCHKHFSIEYEITLILLWHQRNVFMWCLNIYQIYTYTIFRHFHHIYESINLINIDLYVMVINLFLLQNATHNWLYKIEIRM
jgi:hypothetical protein